MNQKNRFKKAAALCTAIILLITTFALPALTISTGVTKSSMLTSKNALLNLVTVSLNAGTSRNMKLVTAKGLLAADDTTNNLIARAKSGGQRVVAMINGGHFNAYYDSAKLAASPNSYAMPSYGMLVDGQTIFTSNGVYFGYNKAGEPLIDHITLSLSLTVNGQIFSNPWGVNRFFESDDAIMIFTPEMGSQIPMQPGAMGYVVKNGAVVRTVSGPFTVAAGETVIVYNTTVQERVTGRGDAPQIGTTMSYTVDYIPSRSDKADSWQNLSFAAAAGPLLMLDGKSVIGEKVNDNYFTDPSLKPSTIAQRSFIAIKKDGSILMGEADASFNELCGILETLGVADAMALDGGDSSCIYLEGEGYIQEAKRKLNSVIFIMEDASSPTVTSPPASTPMPALTSGPEKPPAPSPGSLGTVNVSGTYQTISCGEFFSVGLKSDGTVWTWGYNYYGQLGNGTKSDSLTHVKVLDNAVAIDAGNKHVLAIKSDGTLWAWGSNLDGQIGAGTGNSDYTSPTKIMDSVAAIAAGGHHSAALTKTGQLYAWGYSNAYGQVGDGVKKTRNRPVKVLDGVIAVSAGGFHTAAIRKDNTLWTWGCNDNGQLGDGTTTENTYPVKVMDNVATVSAGQAHTMALSKTGTLWAFGDNSSGQFGNGSTGESTTPVRIMGSVAYISAGGGHSAALQYDGSLWVWGYNTSGQLGTGDQTSRLSPVKIMDAVQSVEAGITHTLTLKKDGSVMSFGNNSKGQLGDGATQSRSVPYQTLSAAKAPTGIQVAVANPMDSASPWAKAMIQAELAKGYIPMDVRSSYASKITRSEFCRMAVRYIEYATGENINAVLAHKGITINTATFTDTTNADILAAFELGVTSGTGNNTFSPNALIPRQQAATMLSNLMAAMGHNVAGAKDAGFGDMNAAALWAKDAINYCRAAGIMNGNDQNNFNPAGHLTRQEAFQTFSNIG